MLLSVVVQIVCKREPPIRGMVRAVAFVVDTRSMTTRDMSVEARRDRVEISVALASQSYERRKSTLLTFSIACSNSLFDFGHPVKNGAPTRLQAACPRISNDGFCNRHLARSFA